MYYSRMFFPLSVILIANCCLGCVIPKGLYRTSWENMSRRELQGLGVSILIPKQPANPFGKYTFEYIDNASDEFVKYVGCEAMLFLLMHPLWSGQFLTEPEYLIKIYFRRMSKSQFSSFKEGEILSLLKSVSGPRPVYSSIHSTSYVDPRRELNYFVFQKDVKLPNNDFVVVEATVLDCERINAKQDIDISEVLKIINSIQPLEN